MARFFAGDRAPLMSPLGFAIVIGASVVAAAVVLKTIKGRKTNE
jgi:hypothetical protein